MENDAKRTPGKWEIIGRDDNYVQIAKDGLQVAHVLTAPGGDVSGRGIAAHIVRACNSHDALVAACHKFSKAHGYLNGGYTMSAHVDPQDWAEFDAALALATEKDT